MRAPARAPTATAAAADPTPATSIAVGDLHVPFVAGKSNNLAFANSNAFLADPDATETSKTMSGEEINGLTCPAGYNETFTGGSDCFCVSVVDDCRTAACPRKSSD